MQYWETDINVIVLSSESYLYKCVTDKNFVFCIDDNEFKFNDASTHEGHLPPNGILIWFGIETAIMISHRCMKTYPGKSVLYCYR